MIHSLEKSDAVKNTSTATAKALSKNKKFTVTFVKKEDNNKLDHVSTNINIDIESTNNIVAIRGKIDFFSFKKRFFNKKIFNRFLPKSNSQIELFEKIHDARSLTIGISFFPGSFQNIKRFLDAERLILQYALDKKKIENLFFYLFESFVERRISNKKQNKPEEKIINITNLLKKNISNHEVFSKYALKLVNIYFNNSNQDSEEEISSETKTDDKKEDPINEENKNKSEIVQEATEEKIESIGKKEDFEDLNKFDELINNNRKEKKKFTNFYSVYTKSYDLIASANNLASKSELNLLKKKLDEESPRFDSLIQKLSIKLERKLMSIHLKSWEFDLEEGILDASKLTRVIINPHVNLTFKREVESSAKNTVVSLLLDNSGSMRGRPIIIAANAVEVLTKTLERCGVKVEILGFTTREWKGGNSKKKWVDSGKKNKPGRLNDLLHIVYKDSHRNWNSCSKNLGLVLKDGLLKENIDGEALIWANQRLLLKEQKKKILIVISDGAPVDDATLSANNANILESHLSKTVSEIQKAKKIDLLAIGIGHDVSKYYKKAFTIDDVSKLAEIMLEKLTEIFTKKVTV